MALELGPVGAYFGTAGAEVDLGKTLGGATIRIVDDSVDLKSDQYGTGVEDSIITGTNVEVELALAEITFDELIIVLSQAKFGTLLTGGITGESNVGTAMLANAKSLVLKKFVSGVVSTSAVNHITFPAAYPVGDVELVYDVDNQRVLKVMFKCFPKVVSANWGTATAINKTVVYYFGNNSVTS